MAFIPKEWMDRIAEFPGRRKLTNIATNEETVVDVERAEGAVSQAGHTFSAENMNDLEQRISDEFTQINSNINTIKTNFTDGCSTIAAAITSQGVSTAANASPATMAANIKTACTNKYNAGVAAAKPTVRSLGSKSVLFGEGGGSSTITFPLNSGEYLQITGVSFKSDSGRGTKGTDSYSLSVSGGNVSVSMNISGGGGTSGTCTVTANAISCSV